MLFLLIFVSFITTFELFFEDDYVITGISSGGYMATQVHMSYSSIFRGAALFASGPYNCAQGSLIQALQFCSNLQLQGTLEIDFEDLMKSVREIEKKGLIDEIGNIKDDKVYIYSGEKDMYVPYNITHVVERMYGMFGASVLLRDDIPSGHAFPTEDYGSECGDNLESPFIQNCDFDAAKEVFRFFYGIKTGQKRNQLDHHMYVFRQVKNDQESDYYGVAKEGFVYIPQKCHKDQGKCKVHIVLHGCEQNYEAVGYQFIKKTGFNRWAEDNGIVVIYPQTKTIEDINPQGCWDWWGMFGEEDYGTKNGRQVKFIRDLIDKLQDITFNDHYYADEMEKKGDSKSVIDHEEMMYGEL